MNSPCCPTSLSVSENQMPSRNGYALNVRMIVIAGISSTYPSTTSFSKTEERGWAVAVAPWAGLCAASLLPMDFNVDTPSLAGDRIGRHNFGSGARRAAADTARG